MADTVSLGIDWGKARIGVAAANRGTSFAYPVETVPAGPTELDRLVAEADGGIVDKRGRAGTPQHGLRSGDLRAAQRHGPPVDGGDGLLRREHARRGPAGARERDRAIGGVDPSDPSLQFPDLGEGAPEACTSHAAEPAGKVSLLSWTGDRPEGMFPPRRDEG